MFVALTQNQQRLSLVIPDPSVNPSPPYYCPVCRQEVMMKQGTKRRWHFAHLQSNLCTDTSEPETEEHLTGKAELYKWLLSKGVVPMIERFLPSIQRRADLFFTYQGQDYAIEFQCASISTEETITRTQDYLSENIIPLWIYSSNRIRSSAPSRFSIHAFEWSGLRERYTDGHRAITYFSPSTSTFFFLFPRAVFTSTITFADLYALQTADTSMSMLLQLPATKAGRIIWQNQWLHKKKQWRYERNDWRSQTDRYYTRHLFASYQSDIPFFPGEAGWPVRGMEYFETPPHLWQSALLLDVLATLPLYHSFSFQTVVEVFSFVITSHLKTRSLPFITTPLETITAGYFNALQKMGSIRQTKTGWMRIKPIHLPRSLDEGFHMDKKWHQSIFYS
ncbi:hypothetical protein D7Z54_23130 [Salibacterium salarium]|uniref:Competence protein CoiA n=1 Tax=Salibacterium salarium TaxID=284579 RepID=A0A428MY21_9BACI|nr:competence protein CoiA family protein [Salibacterium salarium]RSL31041.1 hypothetical protein D7Z54_23130 [Salibacterium salarium]